MSQRRSLCWKDFFGSNSGLRVDDTILNVGGLYCNMDPHLSKTCWGAVRAHLL